MEESPEKAIRLGKASDDKERPLLIILKEENTKRDILQNLNKIREAGAPFDKVTVTSDLTMKQKEERRLRKQGRRRGMMSQGNSCIRCEVPLEAGLLRR